MTTARVPGTPRGCERQAYVVVHTESAAFSDTYGGGGDIIGLDCHLVRPVGSPSSTVAVFMHPTRRPAIPTKWPPTSSRLRRR